MRRRRVSYLVSGDEQIRPSHENLRKAGRHVRHDGEVNDDASTELRGGKCFVVIAHGSADGTLRWYKSSRGSSLPWLWVGMPNAPRHVRLYLYSCKAGRKLPRYLKHCEAFGHVDEVPMPTAPVEPIVLGYLAEVDRLVSASDFDQSAWRQALAAYVDRAYVQEVENPTGMLGSSALLLLRRSLGYPDLGQKDAFDATAPSYPRNRTPATLRARRRASQGCPGPRSRGCGKPP